MFVIAITIVFVFVFVFVGNAVNVYNVVCTWSIEQFAPKADASFIIALDGRRCWKEKYSLSIMETLDTKRSDEVDSDLKHEKVG